MSEDMEKKHYKQYTIRFPEEASKALKDMADEEGVTVAELIRRAINFYDVKLEAKRNDKKVLLEDKDGKREWVMV